MRMIPSFIDDDSPPGERTTFSLLQNSTRNWVAIHSLDLSPDNFNRRTEIDFVLLIPERGIFCIEVKSQRNIYFDGSVWQPESIRKSPFKQALDGRYAFYRCLEKKLRGRFKHVPVMHCCIFPQSDFSVANNVAIQPWEFMDKLAIEQCRTADAFCSAVSRMFVIGQENDPQIIALRQPLTDEEIEEIVEFCYPIRKRKPEKSDELGRRQAELDDKLRLQQKPVMTLCELNRRVLVEGGAGTGKSMIGLEVAKRKAEQGFRVAYLCFNKLIGKWAENELKKSELPNLIAGSAYRILLHLTQIEIPTGASFQWWEEDAPSLIQEQLTNPDLDGIAAVDYLVIDEAQDLLARPALWECIQLLVEKGLKDGSWLVLGDFANQSLTINTEVLQNNRTELAESCVRWLLDENCRNYRSIGQVALTLSATRKDIWSGYMRPGGSPQDWNFHHYANNDSQIETIRECIQRARNDGFRDRDITLLTFCAIAKSVVESLARSGLLIEKAEELNSQHIRYATINAFKGMENKVIIITDVVLTPQNRALERRVFYTGMTRATEQLHIVCRETSVSTLQQWALGED